MNNAACFLDNFRIEVSGWGRDGRVFVETTELRPSEDGKKKLLLRHPVLDGALVFLSLLATPECENSVPVAYQVKNVQVTDSGRLNEVLLLELHRHGCTPV